VLSNTGGYAKGLRAGPPYLNVSEATEPLVAHTFEAFLRSLTRLKHLSSICHDEFIWSIIDAFTSLLGAPQADASPILPHLVSLKIDSCMVSSVSAGSTTSIKNLITTCRQRYTTSDFVVEVDLGMLASDQAECVSSLENDPDILRCHARTSEITKPSAKGSRG